MWPWGHAAIGYLAYTLYVASRRRRTPTTAEAFVVLLGTQLPDAIDKPLAWTFDILPSGRSLGHSLLTATILIGVAAVLLRPLNRVDLTVPFGVGYVVGILTDLPVSILWGEFSRATFVLWPLLPSPEYETEPTFSAHFSAIEPTSAFLVQIVLFVFATTLLVLSRRHYLRTSETR